MLLRLRQSQIAKRGLETACTAIVDLLEHLAEEEATVESVDAGLWPHGSVKPATLEAVLALSPEQRASLHEAVRDDLRFADELDNAGFAFCFPALDEETRTAGKQLLVSMYEEVFSRKGFLVGDEGTSVNRKTWELGFHTSNPDVEVCPACAISVLERPVGSKTLVDADHYLPKATYPALAVHGLNLVPLCKTCNGALKGSKDPLGGHDGPCSLPDIWFPYRRPGAHEIRLSFDLEKSSEQRVAFIGETGAKSRAHRFDSIFSLRERWGSVVDSLHKRLPRELFLLQGPSPAPVDADRLRATLKTLETEERSRHATDPRAFLKSHYLAWLHADDDAVDTLLPQVNRLITNP